MLDLDHNMRKLLSRAWLVTLETLAVCVLTAVNVHAIAAFIAGAD